MRTSLTETKQIENWLLRLGSTSDRLVMEARILSNPELQERVNWQSKTCDLAHLYGREKLREEIKAVENRLFSSSKHQSFQNRVSSIFKQ